jgi:hypothetical protein
MQFPGSERLSIINALDYASRSNLGVNKLHRGGGKPSFE